MKYIETFDTQAIFKLKKLQECKKSILNFSEIFFELLKKHYNKKCKLEEEEPLWNDIGVGYTLKYKFVPLNINNSNVYKAICKISINNKYQITLTFLQFNDEFNEFIDDFFNLKKFYHKIISVNNIELDRISNNFMDEFEFFKSTKKYNL